MKDCNHKFKIIKIEEGLMKHLFYKENVRIYTLRCSICGKIVPREMPIPESYSKSPPKSTKPIKEKS
jgi:hypothetical protein